MDKDDNLRVLTLSLANDHLSLAVEALNRSRSQDWRSKNPISVIIHCYCALEAALNLTGYELFFDPESNKFIKPAERDMPLKRLVNSWNSNLSCLDKFEYIYSIYKYEFPGKLKNELLELNNLRNWVIHGFSYKRTLLLEPKIGEANVFTVVDSEDEIDWKKKFPNTKFNSLHELSTEDAEKALQIVLESLVLLSKVTDQQFWIATYSPKFRITMLNIDTDISNIIYEK